MNTRLLRRIAKVIQEKRGEFDMKWFHRIAKDHRSAEALCELPKDKQVGCGTTHCIAGWAQVLSPKRDCLMDAERDASRLLGLTANEATRLFYADEWPSGFGRWNATKKQAAARIEHFIKTGGRE